MSNLGEKSRKTKEEVEQRYKKRTAEEIQQIEKGGSGKFDEDGFLIFDDGSFYDDEGIFFNKWGFDNEGGHWDESGENYIDRPYREGQPRFRREEIEVQDGSYDEDGFFNLADGGFYDPYGFFFDKLDMDENGGQYDQEGVYKTAEELDELREDNYDDEEEEEVKHSDAQDR